MQKADIRMWQEPNEESHIWHIAFRQRAPRHTQAGMAHTILGDVAYWLGEGPNRLLHVTWTFPNNDEYEVVVECVYDERTEQGQETLKGFREAVEPVQTDVSLN